MLIKRRTLLAAAGASTLGRPVDRPGQCRSSWRAPATTCARRSWASSPSAPASRRGRSSIPRPRPASIACAPRRSTVVLTRRAVRGLRQQREAAAAHRHFQAAQLVDKMHPLLKDGRATPTAPLGFGANPGRMMYVDEARTKVSFAPMFFQMDSIGYNASKIPAENNVAVVGRAVQSQMARQGRHVRHRLAGHAECRHGHAGARPASIRSTSAA